MEFEHPHGGSVVPSEVPERWQAPVDVSTPETDAVADQLERSLRDVLAMMPDPPTGDDSVDEAVQRLTELPERPVREHVGVFEAIHSSLQDRLADAEE